MEGYAKAGIRAVEPSLVKVREFAQKESAAAARRLLDDLGLKAMSSSNQVGLPEPGDARARSLEDLKWKCELAQAIGCDRIVAPSAGTGQYTEDDYKRGADNLREAADIARPFGVSIMLEFTRTSRFAASLPTALRRIARRRRSRRIRDACALLTFFLLQDGTRPGVPAAFRGCDPSARAARR